MSTKMEYEYDTTDEEETDEEDQLDQRSRCFGTGGYGDDSAD
jgi:hypothetical protein